jgi:hypothetical protein
MDNQKTIDCFFKVSNKNGSSENTFQLKKYFYINWLNGHTPDKHAYMLDDRPEKINFIHKIDCPSIKRGYYFYICGYFSDYYENEYTIEKECKYKNEMYLSSLLQKSIRKQNESLAIQAGYHFLKLNSQSLLRRLPIIMLEDTFLHPSLTTVIWLMIALGTKKFKMKRYIYEWILGCIYTCCIIQQKDCVSNINIHNQSAPYIHYQSTKAEILKDGGIVLNNNEQESILYALFYRMAYGGKEHDMSFLQKNAVVWYQRFFRKSSRSMNTDKIRPISIYVKELELDKWDLSAIDFHTNTNFVDFIHNKFSQYSAKEIKNAIWVYSSSVNLRTNRKKEHDVKLLEIWEAIKLYVSRTQKYLLESNY